MRKKCLTLLTVGSLISTTALKAEENNASIRHGSAASQGASSGAIAWAAIGVVFLVAIGIAVAITVSND